MRLEFSLCRKEVSVVVTEGVISKGDAASVRSTPEPGHPDDPQEDARCKGARAVSHSLQEPQGGGTRPIGLHK